MRKKRASLCTGCKYGFDETTSTIHCNIVGANIQPIPYNIGMKFEDCPHRKSTLNPVEDSKSVGQKLIKLARQARESSTAQA